MLNGAPETLTQAKGVLLEVSLVELYEGQKLWDAVLERLKAEGFMVWAIDRGFSNLRDGRTLQCDVTFFRTSEV